MPPTDKALILDRHSGHVPNVWKTLKAHGLHKHWWPQDKVILACFAMHTTQSITLPPSDGTFMSRQEMLSSLFPWRLETGIKLLRLSASGEVRCSGAGQDRLV